MYEYREIPRSIFSNFSRSAIGHQLFLHFFAVVVVSVLPFQKKAGRNPRFATALNDLHLAVLTAEQITTHITSHHITTGKNSMRYAFWRVPHTQRPLEACEPAPFTLKTRRLWGKVSIEVRWVKSRKNASCSGKLTPLTCTEGHPEPASPKN